MGLGLLFGGGDSSSTVQTDIRDYKDSFNTTNESSTVLSESGNIELNLGVESAAEKALPVIVVLVISFIVLYALRKR